MASTTFSGTGSENAAGFRRIVVAGDSSTNAVSKSVVNIGRHRPARRAWHLVFAQAKAEGESEGDARHPSYDPVGALAAHPPSSLFSLGIFGHASPAPEASN
ncbi:hypothetical protein CDD83_10858 [Cordyceps sp. RAO-2017]|nr:hypothetical protein CDD83_10858 [Cordyceps sp. RAO-2017]